MNNKVLIKIENTKYSKLISLLTSNNIYYYDLKINKDIIYLKTSIENYEYLKLRLENVEIIKYLGIKGIKEFIKKHYIFLISFIFTYIVLIILSNVIFNVEIITNNKELMNIINEYLKENKIEKYKFVKTREEINKIKDDILKNNEQTLEWLEIERIGTTYKVYLTERIINDIEEEITPKNIVAKKDALIMYTLTKNGTLMKEVNELVKKGEVIISGNIYKNDEIVNIVAADGTIYGEVWYTVTTTIPFNYIEYEKTGEYINHIYLDLFGKKITLIGKYETNMSLNETEVLVDKPYLFFKVIKETKELYKYTKHNITEEEAKEEAIKRSDKSILNKLKSDEYIIDKKVLKIIPYSSKIEVEVFYKVYENIGISEELITINTEGE